MRRLLAVFLAAAAGAAAAQPPLRAQTHEWSAGIQVLGSKRYDFEGGASVRNDGGFGGGLSYAYHLNDYFALGSEFAWSTFDYRARVVPGADNAGAAFETSGTMDTVKLHLTATWNLLSTPVTPFLTAGAGVTVLDANYPAAAPHSGCWFYPWHGLVCGSSAPSSKLVRLSYGGGAGVRVDLARDRGFVRLLIGGEWLELPDAQSSVGYTVLRADFGLRFY